MESISHRPRVCITSQWFAVFLLPLNPFCSLLQSITLSISSQSVFVEPLRLITACEHLCKCIADGLMSVWSKLHWSIGNSCKTHLGDALCAQTAKGALRAILCLRQTRQLCYSIPIGTALSCREHGNLNVSWIQIVPHQFAHSCLPRSTQAFLLTCLKKIPDEGKLRAVLRSEPGGTASDRAISHLCISAVN